MPSNARDRLIQTRFLGATLALLVQVALIAATLLSLTPVFLPRPAPRETTLWLPSPDEDLWKGGRRSLRF